MDLQKWRRRIKTEPSKENTQIHNPQSTYIYVWIATMFRMQAKFAVYPKAREIWKITFLSCKQFLGPFSSSYLIFVKQECQKEPKRERDTDWIAAAAQLLLTELR